jgi:hypothetical protein
MKYLFQVIRFSPQFLTALVNGVETTQVLSFLGIEWLVAWPCLRFGPVHSALLQRFLFQE